MIQRRSIKWEFAHQAGLALLHLINLRRPEVPINHPILQNHNITYRWMEEKQRCWHCHNDNLVDNETESEEEEEMEEEIEEMEVEDESEEEDGEFVEEQSDDEIIYYSDGEGNRGFIEDELA